ncbi:MAG: WYL domain-containing protein [Syntrophaceae bacterium]|nr:WYL domain-containing protein [Syntrophaceae bacterium]
MSRDKNVQTKLIRVGQILRLFMEKDEVSSNWLSNEFQTTPRTIQRDLLLLKKSGFPIHEIQKGIYQLHKDIVKNLEVFDDTELALMVALRNVVAQLGPPFQKAVDRVLERLYECVTSMPVFVKIDDAMPLDTALLNRMVKAIRDKKHIGFQYTSKKSTHPVQLEPYRVVYFEGFWYLIGNEIATGILKRYALDKIKNLKLFKTGFRSIPKNLDSVLQESANIWFSEKTNLDIEVLIDAKVSNYFKRRKMFPTQQIKEERPDGSLVVTFKVGHQEAIRNILKSWIPHITIIKPIDLRKNLLDEVKNWVKSQEKK